MRNLSEKIVIIVLFSAFLFLSMAGAAEVYRWKGKDGKVYYSDTPPPPGVDVTIKKFGDDAPDKPSVDKKQAEKPPEKPTGKPPEKPPEKVTPSSVGKGEETEKRPFRNVSAIMYVTSWCAYCRAAREYLQSLGVTPTEYDIEKDRGKKEEMLRKSNGARGVPVIDIEGIVIRGYDPRGIKAAVEKRRSL